MDFVKKDGRRAVHPPRPARYLLRRRAGGQGGTQLQYRSGGPVHSDHLTEDRGGLSRMVAVGTVGALLVLDAVLCSACTTTAPVQSRLVPPSTASTSDPLAAVDAQVLDAWRAAETAFFEAEAQPQGYLSSQLDATLTDPVLTTIRNALAEQSVAGEIGVGPWDLGRPKILSLGPSEGDPTFATVVSCVHDTQILVDRATSQPVPGVLGTPDWAATTSQLVRTPTSSWKISTEAVVIDQNRSVACAVGS